MKDLKQILWLFAISMLFVNFARGAGGSEWKKTAPTAKKDQPAEVQPRAPKVTLGAARETPKPVAEETPKLQRTITQSPEEMAAVKRAAEGGDVGAALREPAEESTPKKPQAATSPAAPAQTKPGFIGQLQQGFSDFASKVKTALTPKKAVETETSKKEETAPGLRVLADVGTPKPEAAEPVVPAYREAALPSEDITPREAPPAYPETPAQKGIRAQITKLHDSTVAVINKVTQTTGVARVPTAAEVTTIKGAVSGLCSAVRTSLSGATQSMRTAMSTQLKKVQSGLNSAIAKLPVNSPQRQTLLSSKFALNQSALETSKSQIDGLSQATSNVDKLAAHIEYLTALKAMASSPASTRIGLAQLSENMARTTEAFNAAEKGPEKDALRRTLDAYEQQYKNIKAVEETIKEYEKKTTELIAAVKEEQSEILRNPSKTLKDTQPLSETINKANDIMTPPATRLKQAQAALKRANTQVKATARSIKLSTSKKLTEFATKFKGRPGVKQFVEGISNTRLLIKEIAAGKTPKQALAKVQATVNAAKGMPKPAQQAAAQDIAEVQRLEKDLAATQVAETETRKAAVAQKEEAAAAAVEQVVSRRPLPTTPAQIAAQEEYMRGRVGEEGSGDLGVKEPPKPAERAKPEAPKVIVEEDLPQAKGPMEETPAERAERERGEDI